MRTLYAIFIILLFTILFAGTLTAQYEYISQYMADNHIPGLAACKIVRDSVVWQGYYGYANLARSIPFTDSTSIELASISKTFVATALMQLYERGLFGLDDSINGHLPFRVYNPTYRDTAITFRMLLTHTSSIRDRFPVPPWGGPPGDPTIRLDTLLYHYLVPGGRYYSTQNFFNTRPGSYWSYSSWGATLLAFLVEVMSGVPFEQYTRDSIAAPLQMTNTGWFYRDLDTSLVAHPYTYSGGYVDHYGGSYPIWPSGSLRTNMPSLARYLKMNMQNGHIGGRRILDSATVRLMRTANFERYDPEYGLEGWGLIWYRDTIGGKTLWGHGGSLPGGIRTAMFLSEEDSTGFIVLTNKYDHPWRAFLARFINIEDGPLFALTPTGLAFSRTIVGDSLEKSATVKNHGNGTLTVSSIACDNPVDFSVTPSSAILAPGESLMVRIVFHPADTGFTAGNVVLHHDDRGSPDTVSLAGTGVVPVLFVTVGQSWNMISVPHLAADFQRTAVFPSSIGQAFRYQSGIGYSPGDTLTNSTGYWLKFPAAVSVPMIGVPLNIDSAVVLTGWNLIGSVSGSVSVASIGSIPGGIVTSPFYTYGTAGYEQASTIAPGKGYWVRADQPGLLVLSSSPLAMARIRIVPTDEMPPAPPGEVTAENKVEKPREFALGQNYPNPFNPSTEIGFQITDHGLVTLKIYDVLGREAATLLNEEKSAGTYTVQWDASSVSSGVYFYRLKAGDFVQTKRMMVVR